MRAIAFLVLAALGGCSNSSPCAEDPTSCADGGQGGQGTCSGTCSDSPFGWDMGQLVWVGAPGDMPPTCPSTAPNADPAFANTLPSDVVCPQCMCAPSTGICEMSTTFQANSTPCPASASAPFDAPAAWDGTCTTMDATPSAAALLAQPPMLMSDGCVANQAVPITFSGSGPPALVCRADFDAAPGNCGNPNDFCVPSPVPGFALCIDAVGDGPCPAAWPTKHLLFLDLGTCQCLCGAPVGEACSTTVSVFSDSACSDPVASVMLSSSDSSTVCTNATPAGTPFGSKKATLPAYQSGACAPSVMPTPAFTFCCQP
jgi:hypothetical protein